MTGVVLLGGHRILRAGLRALIESAPDLRVLAELVDPAQIDGAPAFSPSASGPPVLVLLCGPADGPPVALIGELAAAVAPAGLVVILAGGAGDPPDAARRLGARACLDARAAPDDLLRAIRAADGGARREVDRAGSGLSEREREVLALIALGHTNGEIARRLVLSVRTVESHRARIQRKIGRGPRVELVAYAREHGLV